MLHHEAMDKDIATAGFAEEDALGGIVEEEDIVPGHASFADKQDAQSIMRYNSCTIISFRAKHPQEWPTASSDVTAHPSRRLRLLSTAVGRVGKGVVIIQTIEVGQL